MRSRRRSLPFLLATLISIPFLTGAFSTISLESQGKQGEDKVRKLLEQRREVLAKRYDILKQKYADGRMTVRGVIHAREELLEAELELSETKQQRTKILQQRVENLKEWENAAKLRHQSGIDTIESMLAATAARLQSEIDLAKEQP